VIGSATGAEEAAVATTATCRTIAYLSMAFALWMTGEKSRSCPESAYPNIFSSECAGAGHCDEAAGAHSLWLNLLQFLRGPLTAHNEKAFAPSARGKNAT
jgi:hypothetical protein